MRGLVGWAVVLLANASCFSRAANQHHEQRMAEIDAAYQSDEAAIQRDYESALAQLRQVEAMLIAVEPHAHSRPVVRVTDGEGLATLRATCDDGRRMLADWQARGLDSTKIGDILRSCEEQYTNGLIDALTRTYWAADVGWIAEQLKVSAAALDVESLFVYSHNLRLRAFVESRKAELAAARDSAMERLQLLRAEAVASSIDIRNAEVAERRRQFGMALKAAADGMAAASRPAPTQPTYTPGNPVGAARPSGCMSDFDCGVGGTCVKPYYSGSGTCARAVNEYGTPSFDLPRTDSILVNVPDSADCKLLTDCPVGFRCDLNSGACLR